VLAVDERAVDVEDEELHGRRHRSVMAEPSRLARRSRLRLSVLRRARPVVAELASDQEPAPCPAMEVALMRHPVAARIGRAPTLTGFRRRR
jgi:hypothetical protein